MEKLPRDMLLKLLVEVNDISKFSDEQLKMLKEKIEKEEKKRNWEKRKASARRQIKEAFKFLKKEPLTNNYETIDFIVNGIVYKKTYFSYIFLHYYKNTLLENNIGSIEMQFNHLKSYVSFCPLCKENEKNKIINDMKGWSKEDFIDFKLLFCEIFQLPIHSHLRDFFSSEWSDRSKVFVNFDGKSLFN